VSTPPLSRCPLLIRISLLVALPVKLAKKDEALMTDPTGVPLSVNRRSVTAVNLPTVLVGALMKQKRERERERERWVQGQRDRAILQRSYGGKRMMHHAIDPPAI
jgi:hypothetical protein